MTDRMTRHLVLAGYDAIPAAAAGDLAGLWERHIPDAVIVESAALKVEWLEAARDLIRGQGGLPLIMLTEPHLAREVRTMCAGFDDVLFCPLDDARFLLQILNDVLGGSRRRSATGVRLFPTRVTWPTARRHTALLAR